jgi:hypothetical protein
MQSTLRVSLNEEEIRARSAVSVQMLTISEKSKVTTPGSVTPPVEGTQAALLSSTTFVERKSPNKITRKGTNIDEIRQSSRAQS